MEVIRTGVDVFNSIPLYAAVAFAAWRLRARWTMLAALAALIHVLTDFPLHARDARPHFWPFTGWEWASPFSFWDVDHHGLLFGTLEAILFAACFVIIWRQVTTFPARVIAVLFALVYLQTFVHFAGHAFADAHWALW